MAGNFQRNTWVAPCTRQVAQPESRASPSPRSTERSRLVGFRLINCTTANTPSTQLNFAVLSHHHHHHRQQLVRRVPAPSASPDGTSVERHRHCGAQRWYRARPGSSERAYMGRKAKLWPRTVRERARDARKVRKSPRSLGSLGRRSTRSRMIR